MPRFLLWVIGAALAAATDAVALPVPQIDFRDPLFAAADRQASFTATVDGITITLEAGLSDPGLPGAPTLWWDNRDGIGVRYSYEADEVEGPELLIVRFASRVGLSQIFVSDLFVESREGVTYSEIGRYQIDDGPLIAVDAASLMATAGDKLNGEHVIELAPVAPVTTITFSAPGHLGVEDHEFALLGLTDPPVPMPTPASLPLLTAGLAALALVRRRHPS